jgi:hypothetical protein
VPRGIGEFYLQNTVQLILLFIVMTGRVEGERNGGS